LSPRVTAPLPSDGAPALKSSPTALTSSATAIAWQGLPGTGLGGLDGRAAPNLFDLPYDLQSETGDRESARIDGIPIQAAATKGFVTSWWQAVTPDPSVKLTLAGNRTLIGKFVYNLEWELDECAIAHENWLYRINGTVTKGQTIELTAGTSSRNLPYELTRKRKIDDKDIVTPWNPRSDETPRILQIMMFHKAAGGDNYTGLTQRYEPRLDLSNHLTTGRAILIGRTVARPLTWDGDDRLNEAYDQSVTIVRMVIPVEAASSSE
jgi:hypothetical protein